MWWLLIWLVAVVVCAGLGAYVSEAKNRHPVEGVVFGGLLGPLGLLIVAMLPEQLRESPGLYDRDIDPPMYDDEPPLVLPSGPKPQRRGIDLDIKL